MQMKNALFNGVDMNRSDIEVTQRASQIRDNLGENAMNLLASFASQYGLDGGKSVVEGVIQSFAKSEYDIPQQPDQIMQWMRNGIQHAANQVNTPGGEGPAGPNNTGGWGR